MPEAELEDKVRLVGLSEQVSPVPLENCVRLIVPLKPFTAETVIVEEALAP